MFSWFYRLKHLVILVETLTKYLIKKSQEKGQITSNLAEQAYKWNLLCLSCLENALCCNNSREIGRCSKINQFYYILGLKSDANFIKVRILVTPSIPTEFWVWHFAVWLLEPCKKSSLISQVYLITGLIRNMNLKMQ